MFLSLVKENLFFALGALWGAKLRTFLSLLGITIGILAITTVFTIVDSLEYNIRDSIESLGKNVIFIQKWPWTFEENFPWWKYVNRPVPRLYEANDLKKKVKNADAVAFQISFNKTVKSDNNSIENVTISGASHDYNRINSMDVDNGRYFSEVESGAGMNLCLLGHNVARGLFGELLNPVGAQIKISGQKIKVIGVFKKQGEDIFGNSMDNKVLLPINYVAKLADLKSENLSPIILVKGKQGVSNDELKDELMGAMRSIRRLKPDAEQDFSLNEIQLLSKDFDSMFGIIGTAGWIIGGFSILVGGFGIANIMFVSVKERTSLIGIQKSLGAKNYSILMQFLFESVILSLIGGGIGLLILAVLAPLAGEWFGMTVFLSKANVILGITVSFLIGIISGFIPAYGASQLDPVEAIRTS
ncbi:MAG: ABC transporter permease [Bacteroidota bacterium]|jgi:putative ABC transport system permease protein